jgi:hypothetical protein
MKIKEVSEEEKNKILKIQIFQIIVQFLFNNKKYNY